MRLRAPTLRVAQRLPRAESRAHGTPYGRVWLFLKDLGFEKPSWLPDFGGGDDKPAEEPKAEEEAEEAEEAEAASE